MGHEADEAPPAARNPEAGARIPRLERLVSRARAILLFERLWRLAAPPLIVAGLFVCVSFAGLWLAAPYWARAAGSFAFLLALAASLYPALRLRFPTRREALARLDRVSGLKDRPAAALEDRLGNAGGDPATAALWSLHRRRAEKAVAFLKTGAPSPRVVEVDRYALRAAVLVGVAAAAFIAGPQKYVRIAAAFDWRLAAPAQASQRIDAWVDPPAYTGRPPIVLSRAAGPEPQKIEAPAGSIVVIRSSAGKAAYRASGGLAEAPRELAKEPAKDRVASDGAQPTHVKAADANETRLTLNADGELSIDAIGAFAFAAIPDRPPRIALVDAPRANARGSLALRYQITDDYGAIGADAVFADPVAPGGKPGKRSLAEPPKAALQLPAVGEESGEAETTIDLSDHPWAGARVAMTLVARDEGGNEGRSDPIVITLPQKPFVKPLARALVEQRRNLVLNPDDRGRVAAALDALMIEPDAFGTNAGVYLGLRVAAERLAAASKDSELAEVADYLWQMALRIENGDLSEAERDLRAAQQELREALQRNAPPEEIKKLTDNLRAAMDKFLREFAEQQQKDANEADEQPDKNQSRGKTISPKQLQAMLDKMQQLAQNGDSAEAQKMLEEMQNILENLKNAQKRNASPGARQMSRAIDELDAMRKEQQDLRDETYQNGDRPRKGQRGRRDPQDPFGDNQPFGQNPDDGDDPEDADNGEEQRAQPQGRAQERQQADLQKRQEQLRQRLEDLEKRLNQAGQGNAGVGDAQKAMREAQEALGSGSQGNGPAVDAQGRAIEGLREGAQKLAQALREQGEGEGQPGEGEGQAEGEGPGQQGQFGDNGSDPLGRPTGRERAFNPNAKYDPMGVPAAQRAQRVLEELRRRLGEPFRPREETDYLERLLRRY